MELPLRDIHLPDAISDGSFVVTLWIVFFAFLFLMAFGFLLVRKFMRPTLKKQALKKLEAIKQAFYNTEDGEACVAELSIFLRRSVLSCKSFENSAGVTGKEWLELLDKPLNAPDFSQGIGQMLLDGPYRQKVDREQVKELLELISSWVKKL